MFFFQAEDGIRDLVRSRGLGDVYKRQHLPEVGVLILTAYDDDPYVMAVLQAGANGYVLKTCLLYTSDAADERSSVDLGGRRIIKKKKSGNIRDSGTNNGNATQAIDNDITCSRCNIRRT